MSSSPKTKDVLPLAQIPPQTMIDLGYWQCPTIAEVQLLRTFDFLSPRSALCRMADCGSRRRYCMPLAPSPLPDGFEGKRGAMIPSRDDDGDRPTTSEKEDLFKVMNLAISPVKELIIE
ncbi:hypothetical protein TNCV_699171 [Trichonephila clavipes]|nr:hypothetical protein TNCV_699171 [Trichonephila clavipes]